MKLIKCSNCSSRELEQRDGYVVCMFCQSRFVPQPEDTVTKETVIGVDNDILMLLQKCEDDPANRQRYANLILDIDPTNAAAIQYLK